MIQTTAAKNAAANAIAALVDAGSAGGKLKIRASTTVLATVTLDSTAFSSASGGVITAASFPKTVTAGASGTPDNYQVTDSDDNLVASGAAAVGSSECNVDGAITSGQSVTVNSFTITEPTGS